MPFVAEDYAKAGKHQIRAIGWIPLIGLFTVCLGIIIPIIAYLFAQKAMKMYKHGDYLQGKINLNRAKLMNTVTEVVFYLGLVVSLIVIVFMLFYFRVIIVSANSD